MCMCVHAGVSKETTDASVSRVSPGSTVTLMCSESITDENVEFTWSREDGTRIMSGGRFTISGDSKEVLEISAVEEGDSGVYTCKAQTTDRGTVTGRSTLFVGMLHC